MTLRATQITCKTDTGLERRDNEDSAYARPPLFVVADGMGGAQAGEVASQLAIEAFQQDLAEGDNAEQRLADRAREANRRIHERSHEERGREGMGTTLTVAYLEDASLAIAHVGDSRAYLLRDGRLQRLTRDHSLVADLVRWGKLTEEQAAEHPQRSIITRALGPEPDVEVDTWTYPMRPGDVLLLSSDGLTSMISEDVIGEILTEAETLEQAGDGLIAAANEAGGRDNITVVLFRIEEAGEGGEEIETTMLVPAVTAQGGEPPQAEPAGPPPARTVAPQASSAQPARTAGSAPGTRRSRRFGNVMAALTAVLVVVALLGAGGYLATRELYFIGTNDHGVVTVYRGLPYDLPLGIRMYETYYVSGVPASLIPSDRRAALLDNHLRSQKGAANLIRQLELGRISG